MEKDDGHLDTGIFGTRFLVDALVEAGRPDVALTVLQQRTYPGYGFQIGLGATTAWEEWTYSSAMHTYDHAMMAGINASFITEFGGIEPIEPAYEKVRIKPAVPSGLTHVEAAVDTVRGTVSSSWSVADGLLELDVTIPVNATGEVWVPIHGGSADGSDVHASDGLQLDRVEHGFAVFEASSGSYHFRSR
jgi:alpha-L-rhamnosidase